MRHRARPAGGGAGRHRARPAGNSAVRHRIRPVGGGAGRHRARPDGAGRRPRGDDGTVLVLVLGLTGLLLALVAVVVDVSVAVLARRSVASAADGAAVSAAQALDEQAFYSGAAQEVVPLSAEAVADRVAAYEGVAAAEQPGLRLAGSVEPPGTAVVTARRPVHLPFRRWTGAAPLVVTAEARARAPLLR